MPSCSLGSFGTQFLSRLLSSELVSTSFKEQIDVVNAHYREESVCFLHFDCPSQNRPRVNFFNDFDICIHLTWDNGIKYCFLNIPFAFGKPDLTFLDLELSANWWKLGKNGYAGRNPGRDPGIEGGDLRTWNWATIGKVWSIENCLRCSNHRQTGNIDRWEAKIASLGTAE